MYNKCFIFYDYLSYYVITLLHSTMRGGGVTTNKTTSKPLTVCCFYGCVKYEFDDKPFIYNIYTVKHG